MPLDCLRPASPSAPWPEGHSKECAGRPCRCEAPQAPAAIPPPLASSLHDMARLWPLLRLRPVPPEQQSVVCEQCDAFWQQHMEAFKGPNRWERAWMRRRAELSARRSRDGGKRSPA